MVTTTDKKQSVVNFSRPRQLLDKLNPSSSSNHSASNSISPISEAPELERESKTHQISAFKDEAPYPNEPRFSTDSLPSQLEGFRAFPTQPLPTPPSTSSSNKTEKPLLKSILKSTTVEQHSERASSEFGEDTRSHHTVSDEGSGSGGGGSGGKWSSSDADTSMLSEKEIEKLEKKGINPALYCEMQNAKKGNKSLGVGRLTGNAYV